MQNDLTTKVLWKLNVRFAITIVLGLLFTALFSDAIGAREAPPPWVLACAFMTGLIPDEFLRWIAHLSSHLFRNADGALIGLTASSELRKQITGMSFWQADRLTEEGIESVQDLALKELPALLIHTRFDPALLFSWVDRALLYNQAGEEIIWFERASIRSASQLIFLVLRSDDRKHEIDAIVRSIKEAQARYQPPGVNDPAEHEQAHEPLQVNQSQATPLSRTLLENIISGLENGPNLHFLLHYWRHTPP